MKMYDLTISIVLYKSDLKLLKKVIDSIYKTSLTIKLYLIDNSPTNELESLSQYGTTEYIFNNDNIGFGKAHNLAMQKIMNQSTYHLVLNPDVTFASDTFTRLIDFMNENIDVGLTLPKVLNFESQLQYACRRLPSPLDLILRRLKLNFLNQLFERRLDSYEMKDMDYGSMFEAPSLSGCFMLFRVDALKKIGLFDDRYFMYMEDVDISRRVHRHFRTIYYPKVEIFHGHARESYKLNKLLLIHIISAIKYFNKWGWFFDPERKKINSSINKETYQKADLP